jgi:MYXO-CTERM domain-containing protein
VKNAAIAIVLAAGIAAPAMAQTVVELRFEPVAGSIGSDVGGVWTTTASTVTFWMQARASRQGGDNFGVIRVSNGATAPSSISVNGVGNIARGTVNATRRGRSNAFRAAGTSGGAQEGATGNAAGQSGETNPGNENGFWTATSLTRFDAYRGFQAANQDADGNPLTPWGAAITDGSFTAWTNVYAVTVNATAFGNSTISAAAFANIGIAVQAVGSNDVINLLPSPVATSGSRAISFVPTPAAAALLGLGGLVAGRRRR